MPTGFQQVTPQNAPGLLRLLKKLAQRGPVNVTSSGFEDNSQHHGRAEFAQKTSNRKPVIEVSVGGALFYIPITPAGYTPRSETNWRASFEAAGSVVIVRYQNNRVERTRRLQFGD